MSNGEFYVLRHTGGITPGREGESFYITLSVHHLQEGAIIAPTIDPARNMLHIQKHVAHGFVYQVCLLDKKENYFPPVFLKKFVPFIIIGSMYAENSPMGESTTFKEDPYHSIAVARLKQNHQTINYE